MRSLFIFRRDLRLDDNSGLIKACQESTQVHVIFIINPQQVTDLNKYRSQNSIQFMKESLENLEKDSKNKLTILYGEDNKIVESLVKKLKIDKVYLNLDYTPFARKRENILEKIVPELELVEDYTLTPIEKVKTGNDTPYTKFTPYYNKAKLLKVSKPITFTNQYHQKLVSTPGNLGSKYLEKYYQENSKINVNGGRDLGLQILKSASKFKDYGQKRNQLTYQTTHLSAYIKFGCVSLREVYYQFQKKIPSSSSFFSELYWHDFYAQAIYHYPHVLQGKSMDSRFDKIKWEGNKSLFTKWCQGKTGFPIIDAAMNQLNTTGFMHNRARMIVASFLVKTLLCPWRWGEKYFAQQLVDYDPSSNVGGWLWSAGGGFDSQPYFRIFNPWTQSEKFDPNAEYIKKWIPELENVPAKDLHQWDLTNQNYLNNDLKNKYWKPCVDYSEKRVKALEMYKKYL